MFAEATVEDTKLEATLKVEVTTTLLRFCLPCFIITQIHRKDKLLVCRWTQINRLNVFRGNYRGYINRGNIKVKVSEIDTDLVNFI